MADEKGKIKIEVEVDPSNAVKGLEELQNVLGSTEEDLVSLGKTTTKEAAKSGQAIEERAEQAKDALKQESQALENSADVAEKTGKRKREALDNADSIKGLDDLKDVTGELDSSLKGLGGAVGLVSPNMERMLFVTGELSGGVEASSRLTMLFKGSLGALVSPLGLVTVGLVAAGAAFFLLGDDAAKAKIKTEHLEGALNGLRDSADRVRGTELQLRVQSGEITDLQAQLETVEEQVRKDMSGALDAARAPFEEYISNIKTAHDRLVEFEAEMDTVASGSIPMTEGAMSRMNAKHDRLVQNLAAANAAMREQVQAHTDAGRAFRGTRENIEKEIELRTKLLEARIAEENERKAEENRRRRRQRAAEAEARQAEEQRAAEQALAEDMRNRARVADLLAEAQGSLAVIDRQHAKALKEIEELNEKVGLSEEELATLIEGARERRQAAIDALAEANKSATVDRSAEIEELIALEKTQTEMISDEYKQRQAELLAFYVTGAITEKEFAAKSIQLEDEKNAKLAELNRARAMDTLDSIKMATDQATAFMDAIIQAQVQKLQKEEEQALANAEGNVEAQEKIRKDFEKKRKSELSKEFRVRKALEIANAVISGASAAIAALAPPPVGLGPVAGAFLAGGIAATTAAQIAVISQQEPSFHQGGIVGGDGDRQITAQGGEVVLNRDAVAAMGGAASADSLNRGGGMGAPIVVQMTYRNRVFDQMVVDNLAKGGPLKKALGRATRRGQRGRIGGRL